MSSEQGEADGSLEGRVFRSLSNSKRREVLRYLGEKGTARFNEIKRDLGFDEGSSLSYHLDSLSPLLTQGKTGYMLSDSGRDAYSLLIKLSLASSAGAVLVAVRRWIGVLIIINALLWAAALLTVRLEEGTPTLVTLEVFSALWFMSNIALYAVSQRIRRVG